MRWKTSCALRRAAGVQDTLRPEHDASEGLTHLRWKPLDPPDFAPRFDFPEDIARLVRVAREAGYDLPPADAERVWATYSEDLCAGWLMMGDDDEYLLRVIRERMAVLPRWNPLK